MPKIQLYFDFLSPFSYFAWLNHQKQIIEESIKFTYHPVLMGRLFSHHGFPGPGEITAKRNYELKKCFRYAAKNNIPFHPPEKFPFNPLAAIRMATLTAAGEHQYQVIDLLFKQIWAEGQVLDDPQGLEEILQANNLPLSLSEASFTREAKQELKNNINSAIEQNIFGVPSFVFSGEVFWGNDSIESLNDVLKGNDKWNKELYDELVKK